MERVSDGKIVGMVRSHAAFAILASGICIAQVWETRAPFPVRATEVSAAAVDGKVYVVCGLSAAGSRNSLHAYDPYRDTWEQRASAPVPGGADHCNFAAANGKLYLLGAIRIGSSFIDGDTHEYDPRTDRWQTIARMPTPRGASGVAVVGSKIYVAGGLGGNSTEFEVFDTESRQWTRLPNMPSARDHLTAQSVKSKFYAIAGRNGGRLIPNTEEFDPVTNSWRQRAPIPTPRGGVASGVITDRILVFGGEGSSGTPDRTFPQNEEYNPDTDSWRGLPALPTPRHGFYGASLDGRVFLIAGGPQEGASFSDIHEVFYAAPAAPPRVLASGIRNAARLDNTLAVGGLVSVFGERLSAGEQAAFRFPLPVQMNAVTVRVNGERIPLLYVGPGQINVQLPFSLSPGMIRIAVTNAGVSSEEVAVPIDTAAPGVFTLSGLGQNQGAVLIGGTSLIARSASSGISRPAKRGEIIEIYCGSLGAVDTPPAAGAPAPSSSLVRTRESPAVLVDGLAAEVLFSGLAPGLAGLYQVNARIPSNARVGAEVPVTVRIGGQLSNSVTIAIEE